MDWMTLVLPLLSGAAGGNIIGGLFKSANLGAAGNSLAGLVGGGLGSVALAGQLGGLMPGLGVDTDTASLLVEIVGGAIGGGVMTAIVAFLHTLFHRHEV